MTGRETMIVQLHRDLTPLCDLHNKEGSCNWDVSVTESWRERKSCSSDHLQLLSLSWSSVLQPNPDIQQKHHSKNEQSEISEVILLIENTVRVIRPKTEGANVLMLHRWSSRGKAPRIHKIKSVFFSPISPEALLPKTRKVPELHT